jgi:hypothetical protein
MTPGSEVQPFCMSGMPAISMSVRRNSGSIGGRPPLASSTTAAVVPTVRLPPSPGWKKGDEVIYTSSEGNREKVTIVKVHREDAEPYYTILLQSTNRERQTTLTKLSPNIATSFLSTASSPYTSAAESKPEVAFASSSVQLGPPLQPRRPQPVENGRTWRVSQEAEILELSSMDDDENRIQAEGQRQQDKNQEKTEQEQAETMQVVVVERSSSRPSLLEAEEKEQEGGDHGAHGYENSTELERPSSSSSSIPGQIEEPMPPPASHGRGAGIHPRLSLTITCTFNGTNSPPTNEMFPLLSAPARMPTQDEQGSLASMGDTSRHQMNNGRPEVEAQVEARSSEGTGEGGKGGASTQVGAISMRLGGSQTNLGSTHPPLVPPPSYRSPRALAFGSSGIGSNESPAQTGALAAASEAENQQENQGSAGFNPASSVKAKALNSAARSPLVGISNTTQSTFANNSSLLRSTSHSPHRPSQNSPNTALPSQPVRLNGPPFNAQLIRGI